MDLAKLDTVKKSNEGSKLELLHPGTGAVLTDAPEGASDEQLNNAKPFYLTIHGKDSDVYKSARDKLLRKTEQEKKRKDQKVSAADLITIISEQTKDILIECVSDLYLIENGETIKPTKAEIKRVINSYPWMHEQAQAFLENRANFIES